MYANDRLPSRADAMAVLRMPLAASMPASALGEMLSIIDQVYFAHLWLSLAEAWDGHSPFPDEYQPQKDEELYVLRLEVGTPNFLQLVGQLSNLLPVLGVIGSVLALPSAVVTLIKGYYEIREKALDVQIKQQQLRKLLREAQDDPTKRTETEIRVSDIEVGWAPRVRELRSQNKISSEALVHKEQLQNEVAERAGIFAIFGGEPSIIIIQNDMSNTGDETWLTPRSFPFT